MVLVATVYLVHLDRRLGTDHPRGGAQHYLGSTTRELAVRLAEHKAGIGAKLLAAAVQRGIPFDVARVWDGGREMERQLKRQHNPRRLCPTCTEVTS